MRNQNHIENQIGIKRIGINYRSVNCGCTTRPKNDTKTAAPVNCDFGSVLSRNLLFWQYHNTTIYRDKIMINGLLIYSRTTPRRLLSSVFRIYIPHKTLTLVRDRVAAFK